MKIFYWNKTKSILQITGFSILLIQLYACGGDSQSDSDNVQKESSITLIDMEEFSSNDKVTEYFEALTLCVDEYANMVVSIAKEGKKVEDEDRKPTGMDALNMVGTVMSSTMKMAPLLEKMEKLEAEGDVLKGELTPEEAEKFSKAYVKIMERFYTLSKQIEK
jgi:hypothetical protein